MPLFVRLPFSVCCSTSVPSYSELDRSELKKLYYFQAFNVFFVATAAGAIFADLKGIRDDPSSIFNILATTIPRQSSFFASYIMLQALTRFPLELLRAVPLLLRWLKRRFGLVVSEREHVELNLPPFAPYGRLYSEFLLIQLLGFVCTFAWSCLVCSGSWLSVCVCGGGAIRV